VGLWDDQNVNTYRFGTNNTFVGIATMSKNAPLMRSFVFAIARCKIRVRIGSFDDWLCDVYGLQQQFARGFLDLPQDDCTIRKGRNEMANALRNNQVAPQQCAWYAPTTMDVELRAVMHQDVSGTSSWSVTAWLGTLDLLGWGLEDEKIIYLQYVVNGDDLMATGYSEISLSQNKYTYEQACTKCRRY